MGGFKDRYEIEVHTVGFDKNHVHVLCRFLPKYSGGQVVRLMKSITAREVFRRAPVSSSGCGAGSFGLMGIILPR